MSVDLKSIIEAALVMTISSAGAERVFSEMNLAKDKKKGCMLVETTEGIVRIKKNGPDPYSMNMAAYAQDYLAHHERCDPQVDRYAKKRAKVIEDCDKEDKRSTQASEYSKLFV